MTRTLQQLHQVLTTDIKAELAQIIGVDPETGEKLDGKNRGLLRIHQPAAQARDVA